MVAHATCPHLNHCTAGPHSQQLVQSASNAGLPHQLASLPGHQHEGPSNILAAAGLSARQIMSHRDGSDSSTQHTDIWQHVRLPASLGAHPWQAGCPSLPALQASHPSSQPLHLWPGPSTTPITEGPLPGPAPCIDQQALGLDQGLPAGPSQSPHSAPGPDASGGEVLQAGNRGNSYQPNKRKRLKKHGLVKR